MPTRSTWEREALDFLRQHLPDQELVRVWANAEFVSLDGRLNEADAIVLTGRGIPGRREDAHTAKDYSGN